MTADLSAAARLALACLDLTSLNVGDTEADVTRLCRRAQGAHGPVAAVCVWPQFAAQARRELPPEIAVAAVANFPAGGADLARALGEVESIVAAGADEVDVVLPYERLLAGDHSACTKLLTAVRTASRGRVLKVILETGVLGVLDGGETIARAARLAIDAGADFLKTSTGKTPVGATPAAAAAMLDAIAAHPDAARIGFKVSGGVRTIADAAVYAALVRDRLGAAALTPRRLRIGASSLLDDIEAVLGGTAVVPRPDASAY